MFLSSSAAHLTVFRFTKTSRACHRDSLLPIRSRLQNAVSNIFAFSLPGINVSDPLDCYGTCKSALCISFRIFVTEIVEATSEESVFKRTLSKISLIVFARCLTLSSAMSS